MQKIKFKPYESSDGFLFSYYNFIIYKIIIIFEYLCNFVIV